MLLRPAIALLLLSTPALAAPGKPFFSLYNTDFVVTLAFILFVGILLYLKVPSLVAGQLDKRSDDIRAELDEAKALREEAQSLLASYERKQKDVEAQSARIIETAKTEAGVAAEKAKEDLKVSIARRLQAAEDQIASAEASALKEVRDRAVTVAVAAAGEAIAKKMSAADGNSLIDDAIAQVEAKLH